MSRPILWHLPVSHYSEKVRWALDYKAVQHDRRASIGGYHIPATLVLTRGRHYTLPLIELDGRRIGDSTAIIAALEQRYPDPPLYPADPAERRRALELEDFFDEQLGPYIRRFTFHALRSDRDMFDELASRQVPAPFRRYRRLAGAYARAFTGARFQTVSDRRADEALRRTLAALDRLDAELGSGEYLVGGRFTVADLTAAALFYPLVLPPEGPLQLDPPRVLAEIRDPLAGRRGYQWVEMMFARHRNKGASRAGGDTGGGAPTTAREETRTMSKFLPKRAVARRRQAVARSAPVASSWSWTC
jgi:glutathione S-transferase